MANFYIAFTAKQDRNETVFQPRKNPEYDPGYYADVIRCSDSENLVSVLAHIGGLVSATIFPTRKQAREVANLWNDCYKANGTYFFGGGAKA